MGAAGQSRRAWGWHPLTDPWAARVVTAAAIRPGELVYDIGAGDGALTRHLVAAGARVIAVELHPRRVAALRERFADDPVSVLPIDAADLRVPRRPFRVVASPPYGMTSQLLRTLLARGSGLTVAHLVLQKAAARRLADRDHRPWTVHMGLSVPRSAFRPPPLVDSAVLVVRRASR